jgi:hypothetical protein
MPLAEYFIGAGDMHVALLDANLLPLAFRNVGEAPSFEWDPTIEFADNFKTGKTGPNLQDLHAAIKNAAALTIMLKERTAANLALILGGKDTSEAAGSYVANAAFPPGIVVGETYQIPGGHVGVTSLVIKDSAGTPATVANTKYTVNPDAGLVTFTDITGFTQPFKAFSYAYVKSTVISVLEQALPELCVIFDGVNLAVPGERIWARIDRVAFAPTTKFQLKAGGAGGTANAVDEYELKGPALLVPGRSSYGEYRSY